MLHWNSWWVEPSDKSSGATSLPSAFPFDPTLWTPEAWLGWQQSWWDQNLKASTAWLRLYGDTVGSLMGAAMPLMRSSSDAVGDPAATPLLRVDEPARAAAMASPRSGRASARVQPRTRD